MAGNKLPGWSADQQPRVPVLVTCVVFMVNLLNDTLFVSLRERRGQVPVKRRESDANSRGMVFNQKIAVWDKLKCAIWLLLVAQIYCVNKCTLSRSRMRTPLPPPAPGVLQAAAEMSHPSEQGQLHKELKCHLMCREDHSKHKAVSRKAIQATRPRGQTSGSRGWGALRQRSCGVDLRLEKGRFNFEKHLLSII